MYTLWGNLVKSQSANTFFGLFEKTRAPEGNPYKPKDYTNSVQMVSQSE